MKSLVRTQIHPRELLPREPPHKWDSVDRLVSAYERGQTEDIPPAIVYRMKRNPVDSDQNGLYVVDGHHRAGVACMYDKLVEVVFVKFPEDIEALRIVELSGRKKDKFGIAQGVEDHLINPEGTLGFARRQYALSVGIKSFGDWVSELKQGSFYDMIPFAKPRKLPQRDSLDWDVVMLHRLLIDKKYHGEIPYFGWSRDVYIDDFITDLGFDPNRALSCLRYVLETNTEALRVTDYAIFRAREVSDILSGRMKGLISDFSIESILYLLSVHINKNLFKDWKNE